MTWKPFRNPSAETDSVKIADSMQQVAKRLGTAGPKGADVIFDHWLTTVGGDLAHKTIPHALKGGVLTVWVVEQAHMAELKWQGSTIVKQVNAAAGESLVTRVEFRIRRPGSPR